MKRLKNCCWLLTVVVLTAHGQARAQAVAPSAVPASAPVRGDSAWSRSYVHAREQLLDGNFERARTEFEALAVSADNAQDRALATELATLARTYQLRGARLLARTSTERALEREPKTERTTDEIATLYLASVAYGLGTGGWLAVQTEPDDVAGGVLPALGLAGVAAGGVALADTLKPLKYGVPQSITTGLVLGLGEGAAWSLWNQARVSYQDEWDDKTVATVIWGASTAGAVLGGVVGTLAGTTPGRASFVGSAGLWLGAVTGLTAASLSGDEEHQRDDNALLAAALGLNVGAIGGAILAGPISPGTARVRFIDLGGIAGGLVAGGIYVSATDGLDESRDGELRGFFATTATGIGVGLAAGAFFTRNMKPDRGAEAPRTQPLALNVEPTLLPAPGGAMFGVVGTL